MKIKYNTTCHILLIDLTIAAHLGDNVDMLAACCHPNYLLVDTCVSSAADCCSAAGGCLVADGPTTVLQPPGGGDGAEYHVVTL